MAVAYCLHCGDRIYLGKRPWIGQAAYCERCGADLEVTQLNPLELDWTDYLVGEEQDQYGEAELVPARA
jgi:lysine biosynthesis protein LysW